MSSEGKAAALIVAGIVALGLWTAGHADPGAPAVDDPGVCSRAEPGNC